MGRMIDEYMDSKLQQECVSKTIDTLWKMAQKYQKIEQIAKKAILPQYAMELVNEIREVIEDGNNNQHN